MKYYFEQRTREWHELRLGRVTSTRLKTVAHGTAAAQTKLLDYMEFELDRPDKALEKAMEGFGFFTPAAIKLGREREDWLIARFEIICQQQGRKVILDRPGLVTHPALDRFASSPDWLDDAGDGSAGEGKTRTDQTKHEYALTRGLLAEDKDQVYTHMMCAEVTRCDYVSYCPDYPEVDSRIAIVSVELDQIYANYLYAALHAFFKHLREGTRPQVKQAQAGVPSFFDEED